MRGHETFRIEVVSSRPSRVVAVCTCGWRSEPSSSAGVAGAKWDAHRALVEGGSEASGYRRWLQLDG